MAWRCWEGENAGAQGLSTPESCGGEVCIPLQLGCVPWAEGSGMGSTSLGALEIHREREVQSPSLLTGLGAEEEWSFLGTRGAQD